MKIENISSLGGILTSLLAASCCIGPAIFIVMGTSAGLLGKLSFLEPYQPYLLAAASGMIGLSFWKLYVKSRDCNCQEDLRARKIARGIFWASVSFFLAAVVFQPMLIWIYR